MKTTLLILVIGDSIAHGWGKNLDVELAAGRNGNCCSTTFVCSHLDEWQGKTHRDVVILNAGLWDAKEKTAPDKYVANLDWIVTHLNADRIYFCTTTPGRPLDQHGRTDDVVRGYNNLAVAYITALNKMRNPSVRLPWVEVIDLHALCVAHPEWWHETDVHYTEEGYKAMAEYVKHALTP